MVADEAALRLCRAHLSEYGVGARRTVPAQLLSLGIIAPVFQAEGRSDGDNKVRTLVFQSKVS